MFITITTARTIIPHVALLIFFVIFSFLFLLHSTSHIPLFTCSVFKSKRSSKGRLKLIEKY